MIPQTNLRTILRNRPNFNRNEAINKGEKSKINNNNNFSSKEKYFEGTLSDAKNFFNSPKNSAGDWINHCLSARSNSTFSESLHALAKNESKFFGTKSFPRGFQKALAIGFIMEKGKDAFRDDGTFNMNDFIDFIRDNDKIDQNDRDGIIANLENKNFQHIAFDLESQDVKFGNTEYKNKFNYQQHLVKACLENIDIHCTDVKSLGGSTGNADVLQANLDAGMDRNGIRRLGVFDKETQDKIIKSLDLITTKNNQKSWTDFANVAQATQTIFSHHIVYGNKVSMLAGDAKSDVVHDNLITLDSSKYTRKITVLNELEKKMTTSSEVSILNGDREPIGKCIITDVIKITPNNSVDFKKDSADFNKEILYTFEVISTQAKVFFNDEEQDELAKSTYFQRAHYSIDNELTGSELSFSNHSIIQSFNHGKSNASKTIYHKINGQDFKDKKLTPQDSKFAIVRNVEGVYALDKDNEELVKLYSRNPGVKATIEPGFGGANNNGIILKGKTQFIKKPMEPSTLKNEARLQILFDLSKNARQHFVFSVQDNKGGKYFEESNSNDMKMREKGQQVNGENMQHVHLSAFNKLSAVEQKTCVDNFLNSLEELHTLGYIHGDLVHHNSRGRIYAQNSANIMYDEELKCLRCIDFIPLRGDEKDRLNEQSGVRQMLDEIVKQENQPKLDQEVMVQKFANF